MSYSISFCVQENFEVEQAHKLIQSILKNTKCNDIHILCPDQNFLRNEFAQYLNNRVKFDIINNPNPFHVQSHKLPALGVSGKNKKIFVDTSCIFKDDVWEAIKDMKEDIWKLCLSVI